MESSGVTWLRPPTSTFAASWSPPASSKSCTASFLISGMVVTIPELITIKCPFIRRPMQAVNRKAMVQKAMNVLRL
jgi:hypothetical protein